MNNLNVDAPTSSNNPPAPGCSPIPADSITRHHRNKYTSHNTGRIAFGSSNAMIFNQTQATYALQFERTFSVVPRLGLAVYSLDFEYSPTFSTRVTNGTTTRSATLQVSTSNTGQNNQLYLMYMATDHPYIGIFMPAPLSTFYKIKSLTI